MRLLAEWWTFVREYRRHFKTTGSILPSSRFLGRALASELAGSRGPCHILEVGPGTGAVTRQILKALQPDDRLDLVELNDRFVAVLKQLFEEEPAFRERREQV